MDTFTSIIDTLGAKHIAEKLGVAESHVRTMRARDSIPPEYWPALVAADPSLTFERLVNARRARFTNPAVQTSPAAADSPGV